MAAGGWVMGLLLATLVATQCFFAWQRASEHAGQLQAFQNFLKKHGKKYKGDEWQARFEIFKANMAFIQTENSKGHSYTLGVNSFADQTPREFSQTHLGMNGPAPEKLWGSLPHLGTHQYSGELLPASIDWVAKGAVTAPKNQAQCGSCWSFSSTGALEGAWQVAGNELVSLSEQQLVDCSKDGNMGCSGGSMDIAFTYLKAHGVCTEASYPYLAKEGKCHQDNCTIGIPLGDVKGFKDVPAQDMQALMEAVAMQPVSVAIEADQMAFQLYTGGILSKSCGAKLDHGVLLVGYGTEDGVDYWKVKNSWGAGWGEEGYIRMKRGVPKDGECGIQDGPTYPVVKKAAAPAPAPESSLSEVGAATGSSQASVSAVVV